MKYETGSIGSRGKPSLHDCNNVYLISDSLPMSGIHKIDIIVFARCKPLCMSRKCQDGSRTK